MTSCMGSRFPQLLRQISESANHLSSVSARRPCSSLSAGTVATYKVQEIRATLYITLKAGLCKPRNSKVGKRKLEILILKLGINIWVASDGETSEKKCWFLVPVIPFLSTSCSISRSSSSCESCITILLKIKVFIK